MPRPDAADKLKAAAPKQGPSKALIASVIAVVLVIAGFAAFLVTQSKSTSSASAAVPSGALEGGKGLVLYPDVKLQAGAKTVNVYEDFQCPVCKQFETQNGDMMKTMAKNGQVKVVVHMMSFLDNNFGNDASAKAANAGFCAADADKFPEYHSTVYANQPATEGTGYTVDQLKSFGKDAGITGAAYTTFVKCVDSNKYKDFVNQTETQSGKDGVTGTPTFFVDGKEIDNTGTQYKTLLTQPNSFESVINAVK